MTTWCVCTLTAMPQDERWQWAFLIAVAIALIFGAIVDRKHLDLSA